MCSKISDFWSQHINSRLVTLSAAIGTIGIAICLVSLLILSYLFEEVIEGQAFIFDESFLLRLHQYANPNLDAVMLVITRLGNPEIILPVSFGSIAILWWNKYQLEAKVFAVGCLGTTILNMGLKLVVEKSRPKLWSLLISETSFSFPSGHALGSLFIYGFLAYLLARRYPKFSLVINIISAMLIILIGFSRLYLGVHWLTDVLAGYGIAAIWLITCITILKVQKKEEI